MKKNKRKAVSMLVERDLNSMLKQSFLFSGILNKVDQMEFKLVKKDEKISNIKEKIKGFASMLRFLVIKKEIVLIQMMNLLIMVQTSETQIYLKTITHVF